MGENDDDKDEDDDDEGNTIAPPALLARVELVANDAPLGTNNIEVDGADLG
jgi:hypothetical protein